MSDKFKAYLNLDHPLIKQALTDRSYKKIDQEIKINQNLATLGDSILKFILSEIFYQDDNMLSEIIKPYLTDANLVKKIAKHYNLINFIKKDKEDINLPDDYNYKKRSTNAKSKNCVYKYIATALEAVLGAIYLINNNLKDIKDIIQDWIKIIEF